MQAGTNGHQEGRSGVAGCRPEPQPRRRKAALSFHKALSTKGKAALRGEAAPDLIIKDFQGMLLGHRRYTSHAMHKAAKASTVPDQT